MVVYSPRHNARIREFARFILENTEQFDEIIKFIARKIYREQPLDEEQLEALRYAYVRYEREFENRRSFDDTITSTVLREQPESQFMDPESINIGIRMIEREALLREREKEKIQPKQPPSDKIEYLDTTMKYGPENYRLVNKINEIITKINMNNELNFRESL